jgi:hypothetical protein
VFPLLSFAPAEVAAVVLAGSAVNTIGQIQVPESENHRFLIESTRYLNNQLLRADLRGDSDRLEKLNAAQADIRRWLLNRMQSVLRSDFIEYNVRAYQRESIAAMMNLYDFAEDGNVRDGARLVIEYAVAKFAAGSNQSRRFVPFRRRMEDVKTVIETGRSVLDFGKSADHQPALGLLYLGQTQQLSNQFAPPSLAGELAIDTLSWYQPSSLVLDLGIDKSSSYLQRIRHGGMEAYASGKGYLITDGASSATTPTASSGSGIRPTKVPA